MRNLKSMFNNTNVRNSSIELLRIVCMLMIVFHHFARHGEFQFTDYELTIPKLWYNFIIMGGKIGVNIFVLISGYFLINNNKSLFNFQRIKKTWDHVFFYSVVLELFFITVYFIFKHRLDLSNLLGSFFPITTSQWWFASTYFVLYLIHPFLNKILHSIDKKTYQAILLVSVFCWCIIPTFTKSTYESNELLWFIFIYSLAGYLRIYGLNINFKNYHYAILTVILTAATYLSSVLISLLKSSTTIDLPSNYFYGMQTLPVLLISVCCFITFEKTNIKSNKFINIMASATFGVYLIHENHYLRNIFWQTIFQNASYQNSIKIIPMSIIAVVLVYIVCTITELIRQLFIEKTFSKITDILLAPFVKLASTISKKL